MSLVRATGVGVDFGVRRILDDLSLDIEAGERYALLGRSGSGKTTLLLVLAGLLPPSRGNVSFSVDLRSVTYVPQMPSLVAELSAVENVALGLRIRAVPRAEAQARARDGLASFGLADALDAMPDELSGGMQQRVALARAAVLEPRVLLTDEPTGSLDQHSGAAALATLDELGARAGTALVVATHDPHVAELFPRRISLSERRVAA